MIINITNVSYALIISYLWLSYYYIKNNLFWLIIIIMFHYLQSGLMFSLFPGHYALVYYLRWTLYIGIIWFWCVLNLNQVEKNSLFAGCFIPVWALCFIGMCSVSAVLSDNVIESWLRTFTFLSLFVLAFYLVPLYCRSSSCLYRPIFAFDVILVLISLGCIFSPQCYLGTRFGGVLEMPTNMVIFPYTAVILAISRLFHEKTRTFYYYLLLAIVAAIMILLTKSRAGILAVIIGSMVVVYHRSKTIFFGTIAIFLLLLCYCIVDPFLLEEIPKDLLRAKNPTSYDEVGGVRLKNIQGAWGLVEKHPFFGIGLGTVPREFSPETPPGVPFAGVVQRVTPQAGYHALLVETGLLGLACYLLWLWATLSAAWRLIRNRQWRSVAEQNDFLGLTGIFLAYAVHGIFEGFPGGAGNIPSLRMWLISGLISSYYRYYGQLCGSPFLLRKTV